MLKVLGNKDKPRYETNYINSSFSITLLRVGRGAGVNGLVVITENQTRVHTWIRGNNMVTKYVFPEGHYVIPNKAS